MDSKDPGVHDLDGWMLATKTHPECSGGIQKKKKKKKKKKKGFHKDLAGNAEDKESKILSICIIR